MVILFKSETLNELQPFLASGSLGKRRKEVLSRPTVETSSSSSSSTSGTALKKVKETSPQEKEEEAIAPLNRSVKITNIR